MFLSGYFIASTRKDSCGSGDYGYLTNTKHTLTANATTVMELTNDFDLQRGNLNWRKNSLFGNVKQDFTFDNQDRLLSYPNASGTIVNQSYEDDGRIKTNTLGAYNYNNINPDIKYQNTSITLTPEAKTYYQAKPTQTITYNVFKSPVEIEEPGIDKISFAYNDGNDRAVMYYGGLQPDKTQRPLHKYYSADGSMEIKVNTTTGATEFVTYIGGDAYDAPVVYKKTVDANGNDQEQMLYLHRDYQGSILAITNDAGTVLEKRLFDAWGSLIQLEQNGVTQLITNNLQLIIDRGYTGHEHLLSVGLINMNGRIYDPKLHRFLQPDNFVQDPYNTQNYNRYGYVLNNPLKYTDPSGESALCPTCGTEQQPYQGPNFNGALYDLLESQKGGDGWLGKNFSARNFDEAGTAVGKAFRDATNWVTSGISGLFGGNRSAPAVQVRSNADIHVPTQHTFLGINMTVLSEGNFFQQVIYGAANSLNIPVQWMMGRGVGDGSMRNLDGTSTSTDEGVMAFGSLPLWFVGGGETGGMIKGGGKTFAQYRTAYWAGKTKPVLEPLQNEATGQIWKQYMELHHRFIPQRWDWAPNWLKNNRFNLQELNSLDHAMADPYRARFAPRWVKEQYNLIWK